MAHEPDRDPGSDRLPRSGHLLTGEEEFALFLAPEGGKSVRAADPGEIPVQEPDGFGVERNPPGPAALAVAHCDGRPGEIEVTELNVSRFLNAQADVNQKSQQCQVSSAQRRIRLAMSGAQESIDNVVRQRARGGRVCRHVGDAERGVLDEDPLFGGPGTEGAKSRESAVDGTRSRTFVLLTKPLPGAEIPIDEKRRIKGLSARLLPPAGEMTQVGPACPAGRRRDVASFENEEITVEDIRRHEEESPLLIRKT
jgi:hypothetical protein